jgi:hypothetical protein
VYNTTKRLIRIGYAWVATFPPNIRDGVSAN